MKSFFRRLFGGRAPQRAVRTRRLMLETCESRQLLCDDLTALPTAPPSEPTSPPAAVVLPPTAPAPETPAPQSPPAALFGPNQPPQVTSLLGRAVLPVSGGVLWSFTGTVQDDHLGNGVTISFLGMLNGTTTSADPITGNFTVTRILEPNARGVIYAVATDANGLQSPAYALTI